MTTYLAIRSSSSGPALVGTVQDQVPLWDVTQQKWYVGTAPGGGAVDSVFGRTGAVVAATGDYDSDQVDNVSGVPGVSVSDALDYLLANAGAVASVFGRVGVVVAATGDYDSDQVDNASNVSGASVSDALDALNVGGGFQAPTANANLGATPLLDFAANRYVRGILDVDAIPTVTLPTGYLCFLELQQPAAGATHVVTSWPSNVDFSSGLAPTLSTANSARDLLILISDGTNLRLFAALMDLS